MAFHYRESELRRVLDAGPAEGDDFYRVQVSGKLTSRTLNLSPDELARMVEAFAGT